MLPAHVDTWAQTSPTTSPDPDVSLFLYGPASVPPEVQLVLQPDLPYERFEGQEEDNISTVAFVPPTIMVALPVPIYAARAWLLELQPNSDVTDWEGEPDPVQVSLPEPTRRVLRW